LVSNLRQLIQAVHMYEQDWGIVPIEKPTKTKEGWYGFVQQMLFPYVQDTSLFICPTHRGIWFTEPIWKGKKWFMSYQYYVNEYTVKEYGKGSPYLRPYSVLFTCLRHRNVVLIARYNGIIELSPLGYYLIIRAEFEKGPTIEEELENERKEGL